MKPPPQWRQSLIHRRTASRGVFGLGVNSDAYQGRVSTPSPSRKAQLAVRCALLFGGMDDLENCLASAREGSDAAWRKLVDGHKGLVWSIIRGFRFDSATSDDVFQTVWLRLAENIDRIRDADRLASWLGQTTRNQCIGVTRQRSRTVPAAEVLDYGRPVDEALPRFPQPGESMERDLDRMAVAAAFDRLGERCRLLLSLLLADPPLPYDEIADILGLAVGSVGPTRARCLKALENSPEVFRISSRVESS